MPFINGRYYINPVMGEAMEAAREAEAALTALEQRGQQHSGVDNGAADDFDAGPQAQQDAPVHRVEIEAAEVVPAHSGRATQGYVARVHRQPAGGAAAAPAAPRRGNTRLAGHDDAETHVFTDHRDLLSFLRDQLAKDAQSRASK